MASRVRWVDFDCADPYKVASFWAEATGMRHHPDNKPGDEECALLSGADIIDGGMLFQRVPEGKVAKNSWAPWYWAITATRTGPAGQSSPTPKAMSSVSNAVPRNAQPLLDPRSAERA
jgi:hypothetical protein